MAERFVKIVKNSLLCCHLENGHFESKIQEFLLNYRNTPVSTTEKSPFETVFGRKMDNFLPTIPECKPHGSNIQSADYRNKLKQKEFADKNRRAKKHILQPGDYVLCKQVKKDNLTSHYDPKPYEVIQIIGSTVKAKRENQVIARNASFFKKFYSPSIQGSQRPIEEHIARHQEVPIIQLKFAK